MLEQASHQAQGLQSLTPTVGPRLISVVSHGDERAELPLLWRICQALTQAGHTVTVLDASTCETQDNPGLAQRLDDPYGYESEKSDGPAWTIVPSRIGVQNLVETPGKQSSPLKQLGKSFPHEGLLILYSNAEWLVSLMGNTSAEPLLAMSTMKSSLMTSYLALKRLLKKGSLEPVVVHWGSHQRPSAVCLGDCAKNFLDYEVKSIRLDAAADDAPPSDAVRSLAMRLIENAVPLMNADQGAFGDLTPRFAPSPFTGSH
jgi:hypothetical protein